MDLGISALLAGVMLALAIVYALSMQTLLSRIFGFKITRRRKKAFFFWNSVAFVFKVMLPIVLLIPSGFMIWYAVSSEYWHGGRERTSVFFVAAIVMGYSLLWLNTGVQSVQRSFEVDYQQKRVSILWWIIMLLTWLFAFFLSELTVALYAGGYAHMRSHREMRVFVFEPAHTYESDCWICRMEQAKKREEYNRRWRAPKVEKVR